MLTPFWRSITVTSLCIYSLFATSLEGRDAVSSASKLISLGHTEGKGLGYTQGYTSLDLFLAHPRYEYQIIPLVDLRGHVFNKGRFAGNLGVGLRWFNPYRIWGANLFYDSLSTSRTTYHQIGCGFELLNESWDLRINGYIPVGRRKTPIYKLSYDFSTGFLAKAREQFSMGGFDAELGYHFKTLYYIDYAPQLMDWYIGLGPYFYWGRSSATENAFRATRRDAIGGRLRLTALFLTYFKLEAQTTYDRLFKWTGQVTLSLNIPLDCIWNSCCPDKQIELCVPCDFAKRLFQPIIRNEIIVTHRINRFSTNPLILDPKHSQ